MRRRATGVARPRRRFLARPLAQGVADGDQVLALRRCGIEQLLPWRRLVEPTQLHQGARLLASRQPVLAGPMAEEQAEQLALAQQIAELGCRHVEQEAD